MRWFWQQYAPDVSPTDPNVSPPQLQEVPSLPPTLVATAEYDVLRDEGVAYAEKLKAAGTAVTHLHAPDMGHNFPATPNVVGRFPQGNETLAEIADWLRATVAGEQELLFDHYVQSLRRYRNLLRPVMDFGGSTRDAVLIAHHVSAGTRDDHARIVPNSLQPLGWGTASVEPFDSAEDLLNGYCPLPGSGITSGFVSANL
jgi:alpha/beta hydrolase fold